MHFIASHSVLFYLCQYFSLSPYCHYSLQTKDLTRLVSDSLWASCLSILCAKPYMWGEGSQSRVCRCLDERTRIYRVSPRCFVFIKCDLRQFPSDLSRSINVTYSLSKGKEWFFITFTFIVMAKIRILLTWQLSVESLIVMNINDSNWWFLWWLFSIWLTFFINSGFLPTQYQTSPKSATSQSFGEL